MKEIKNSKRKIMIAILGMLLLISIAIFCYQTVEKAIVSSEQESMKSIAKVNAQSLMASLRAKSNLVYAALSGDMTDKADIEKGMLKIGEKGEYFELEDLKRIEEWRMEKCEEAGKRPGEVVTGPIKQSEEGHYVLYMTKAVYMKQSISGYVQIELNLDEIYEEEQALSSLQLANNGYCIVKNMDEEIIMPSYGEITEEQITSIQEDENGHQIILIYGLENGILQERRKLIAHETINVDGEEFVLYIIEDYDQVIQPIERIAFYFCVLGILILVWTGFFVYKIVVQQKEEEQLVKELKYEKELNKANEAIKNQESLMQKYNHSKTMEVLTGAIAHEFNNLMTPIVLYAELLEENEQVRNLMGEEIKELSGATKNCGELARQLLAYSRQGRAEKVLVEYNATFAVQESIKIVKKLLPSNIILKMNITKTPYYVKGQMGALNQIILNLVTNAMHAMPHGGTISIQFGLSTDSDGFLRMIVEDTGTGISPEIQRQVFQPFFTTKEEGKGTGIGLTVVKRLTEEHGGSIRVLTKENEGTTFVLDFLRVSP